MARYFFNVMEDNHKADVIGAEYPNAEIARMEAVRFAADLLKAEPERLWKGAELRIEAEGPVGHIAVHYRHHRRGC